ncbi:MAG: P-loop NTPase [Proteobacteria bacterium]|nr:P-loop NTPase [Pseudomonadota bacterium]MBU1716562.1 P-loop NTPase [Pseudomonadota bacterium]
MKKDPTRKCEIWAVGGGKGGVGKSFVLSSIGMSLAQKGKVVMVDADLGGANLHNFLGLSRPSLSLTDFFERKIMLSDLIVDSGIANLGLLTGAIGSIGAEGIKHSQKNKFFNHIKKLDTDYVLIDLGAGTHFNTIDTFLLAEKMIIVITPEIISIENMYNFLRNVFFRRLGVIFTEHGYRDLIMSTWQRRAEYSINNFKQLVDFLRQQSTEIAGIINSELSDFKVHIILNQARNNQDIMIGNSVKSICLKFFGIHSLYSGYVEYDELVSRSVNQRQAYMKAYPLGRCAREIERITGNLLSGRQVSIIK